MCMVPYRVRYISGAVSRCCEEMPWQLQSIVWYYLHVAFDVQYAMLSAWEPPGGGHAQLSKLQGLEGGTAGWCKFLNHASIELWHSHAG